MNKCTIIGISDSRNQWFSPDVLSEIAKAKVFSGGKRHHEIMSGYLPEGSQWIDITVPLDGVFEAYKAHDNVVIFASGDPLFYGFAATVQRRCPECDLRVMPYFNSLQTLCHRLCLPYQDMRCVSLTGRPWDGLDEALIQGEKLIGCLTDKNKTPDAIFSRLKTYGYTNYEMMVGERLGNEHKERVSPYREGETYQDPNCVLLRKTSDRQRYLGIPEELFSHLNGRSKMITKAPIRLCTLSVMDLYSKTSFWDVGFCTGSVSIEARLQFPHLHITAFEVREEAEQLMKENSERFGAPGIESYIGDFMEMDIRKMKAPDAVFIGGHGGRLKEMIAKIRQVLLPGGIIVFNSVSEESRMMFLEGAKTEGMSVQECRAITVDAHNTIKIMKAL